MPQVFVCRRESFSSAHCLHSNYLTQEQNKLTYGKCNNKNSHGHNYVIEVTVVGHPDNTTGMVVNIADLKMWIKYSQVIWCWNPVRLAGYSAPVLVYMGACGLCYACKFLEEISSEQSIRLIASLVMEG